MADANVLESDERWAVIGGVELQVRIYRDERVAAGAPVMLDVHGGAWNFYDRTAGALYARALAERGFLVASIDFRDGPEFKHPAASEDVARAIDWLRDNAERLGGDRDRIGLIGSSSGGHLALLAAVTADPAPSGDPAAAYVIALWPVSDPHYRYRYARRAGIERLVAAHDAYFVSEAAMREASVPRIVLSGEARVLPPALVVQPGEDSNVPIEMTFDLLRAWQSRGGYIEYAYFPDQPHAFGHQPSAATTHLLEVIAAFARRHSGSVNGRDSS